MIPESYLYVVTCLADNGQDVRGKLATFGQVAALNAQGCWLLAVDADYCDENDLHAGALLEQMLDELGEEINISVMEVSNIATYNILPEGDELLDQLYPTDEEE